MRIRLSEPALLYGLLAVVFWSTVSTAFKLTLCFLTPLGLLFFASLAATIFLCLYLLLCKEKRARIQVGRQMLTSLKAGALNPFCYYLMLFNAYDRLPAQQAQVLNYTWAIVLPLMSLAVMKERLRWVDLLALLMSFLGVIVISTRGKLKGLNFEDPVGLIIAISTSIVWAAYWILNIKDSRPAAVKLTFNFASGTLLILIWSGATFLIAKESWFLPQASVGKGLLGALYIGIFEMGLTFLIWYKALEKAFSTAAISNLIFATPFLALVFIALILHERIYPATVIGLIIIIVSNLIQRLRK